MLNVALPSIIGQPNRQLTLLVKPMFLRWVVQTNRILIGPL